MENVGLAAETDPHPRPASFPDAGSEVPETGLDGTPFDARQGRFLEELTQSRVVFGHATDVESLMILHGYQHSITIPTCYQAIGIPSRVVAESRRLEESPALRSTRRVEHLVDVSKAAPRFTGPRLHSRISFP